MIVVMGVVLGLIVVAGVVRSELRSALCGLTLSNGVEVLVSEETYREIVRRFQASDPGDGQCWDEVVLEVLRPDRPHEWRFLARSLGYHVVEDGIRARRRRRTVGGRTV
jgi:hypothetical protein